MTNDKDAMLTEPTDEFQLENHVGFLLRKAYQRHASIFLETAIGHGLTPTQFAALNKTVALGSTTQNRLGRCVAMDPATIQGVVRRLIARGLIATTNDPMDKRTIVLTPTESGIALAAQAVTTARLAHAAALSPLAPDERETLLTLLRKLA